jgi:hypothetical protein
VRLSTSVTAAQVASVEDLLFQEKQNSYEGSRTLGREAELLEGKQRRNRTPIGSQGVYSPLCSSNVRAVRQQASPLHRLRVSKIFSWEEKQNSYEGSGGRTLGREAELLEERQNSWKRGRTLGREAELLQRQQNSWKRNRTPKDGAQGRSPPRWRGMLMSVRALVGHGGLVD